MSTYTIEITDTFGGEANYCWVKRFQTTANTMQGAITKLAKEHGGGFRFSYGDSESSRYDVQGSCICAFVNWVHPDDDILNQYNYIKV